jgi:methionyl aminopeptidase
LVGYCLLVGSPDAAGALQWTAATVDGKPSAQFEEALLITPTGVEVLTAAPGWSLPSNTVADEGQPASSNKNKNRKKKKKAAQKTDAVSPGGQLEVGGEDELAEAQNA